MVSRVLAIVAERSAKKQIELAFQKEIPEVCFDVIGITEFSGQTLKELKPDMVIVEKGYSDLDDSNLIREIHSVSKSPIVLMATERDASYTGPADSDKYEGIFIFDKTWNCFENEGIPGFSYS